MPNGEENSIHVANEKEWRKYLISRLDRLESEQKQLTIIAATLKLKIGFIVATVSVVVASVCSVVITWVQFKIRS